MGSLHDELDIQQKSIAKNYDTKEEHETWRVATRARGVDVNRRFVGGLGSHRRDGVLGG
jgi:hypothetical protein